MEYHGPRARKKHASEIAEARRAADEADPEDATAAPVQEPSTPGLSERLSQSQQQREIDSTKDLIWALALGFGAASCGFFEVPLILYPIPLGLGLAGGLLCVVAISRPGGATPWYSILAVLASAAGIILGGTAYSDYRELDDQNAEAQEQLEEAQKQLEQLGVSP